MLNVSGVRAFNDNYIWLVHAPADEATVVVVDPGDAAPVFAALKARRLELGGVLATHHHFDHTGGIVALVDAFDVPVFAPARERTPIAGCTQPVSEGDRAEITHLGLTFEVMQIPGHTAGHIAFFGHGAVFCGDTLFSAGCGRLFEGTPAQMLRSLDSLSNLPDDTQVYCGHEYTQANLRFAAAVEPDNQHVTSYTERAAQLRTAGQPTLPSTIALEKQVNPFLRCEQAAVRDAAETHAGARLDDTVAVFAAIRRWKDAFS